MVQGAISYAYQQLLCYIIVQKRFLPAFIEASLGLFVHRTVGDASLSHQSNIVLLVPLALHERQYFSVARSHRK
jgi:hypothetical protein